MQQHTVQQLLDTTPRPGKWVYTGGNRREGRYIECCADAVHADRWNDVGHDTAEEAYAHMRAVLLGRLKLDGGLVDWAGCRAPLDPAAPGDVHDPQVPRCDRPTKAVAEIPPCYLMVPLCDEHRTRDVVEAMWDGPGDWSGSW
jgi:hypothetical protein